MNITIPVELAEALKKKPNKSAFIAEALRERFAAEEKELRSQVLARAYREAAGEEKGLREDWDASAGDGLP